MTVPGVPQRGRARQQSPRSPAGTSWPGQAGVPRAERTGAEDPPFNARLEPLRLAVILRLYGLQAQPAALLDLNLLLPDLMVRLCWQRAVGVGAQTTPDGAPAKPAILKRPFPQRRTSAHGLTQPPSCTSGLFPAKLSSPYHMLRLKANPATPFIPSGRDRRGPSTGRAGPTKLSVQTITWSMAIHSNFSGQATVAAGPPVNNVRCFVVANRSGTALTCEPRHKAYDLTIAAGPRRSQRASSAL